MPTDFIGYLYAATVAAGGIAGYAKAGSIPSLGAGLLFGTVLGFGAHMNSQDPPRPLLQLTTAIVLAGMMGSRYMKSGKFMPPGLICLISCAAALRNLSVYNKYLPVLGDRN